jgi:hypothetical protein
MADVIMTAAAPTGRLSAVWNDTSSQIDEAQARFYAPAPETNAHLLIEPRQ